MSSGIKYLKKIKKDYQRNNSRNPFFHKPKKKPKKRFFIFILIAVFLLAGFIIWLFFDAPIWKINNIKIEGLTRISDTEIKNKIWEQTGKSRYFLFKQSNIWLFDKKEVGDSILASYNLASIDIIKHPAKTILVKIGERPYSFIFQQGNSQFYASIDGFIIRETAVSEEDRAKYLILENKNNTDLINENNKINISEEYLNFILELANQLASTQDVSVERFVIDQEFNTVKVKFRDGPLVYFNTRTSAKDQVDRLVLVKREKIKDNFSKTSYIDLRYGDRIFIN